MRSLSTLLLTVAFVIHFCLDKVLNVTASCPTMCRLNYNPVCGIRFGSESPNHCTFFNLCILILYICRTKEKWQIMSTGTCEDTGPDCEIILDHFSNQTELFTLDGVDKDDYMTNI